MARRMYTVSAINGLISEAVDAGYDVVTVEEGVLGFGTTVLIAPREGYYNFIVQERYLNEWSSGHTVRRTQKLSKAMIKQIDAVMEQQAKGA